MVIRRATVHDMPALLDMAGRFFASTHYAAFMSFSRDDVRATLAYLLESGVIFLAEVGGEMVGGIAGLVVRGGVWFDKTQVVGQVMAWWVEPGRRGFVGGRLLKRFELWATSEGATVMSASLQVAGTDTSLGAGYSLAERVFIKRV